MCLTEILCHKCGVHISGPELSGRIRWGDCGCEPISSKYTVREILTLLLSGTWAIIILSTFIWAAYAIVGQILELLGT